MVLTLLWCNVSFAKFNSIFPEVAVPVKNWEVYVSNYYNHKHNYITAKSSIAFEDAKSKAISKCKQDKDYHLGKPEGCLVYKIRETYKKSWRYFAGTKILPPREKIVWEANVATLKKNIADKKKLAEKPKKKEPKKKEPEKKVPEDDKIVPAASGSGFFVSNNGDIITNHHVIDQCKTVKVNIKGTSIEAKTLAIDKVNDIAILKANIKPDKVYSVSNEDVSLLEDVIVAGYPLGKKVSSAIKTHKGVVTSLAGAGDNYSNFQTDATINQGNSGGPIMNQKGNIVGIAVATWVEEGVQGVHFGIKSSTLKTFASANGLEFLPPNNKDLSNKELGKLITQGTVYLECHMTIAKIKKMIAEANNRKAFFSEYQ